jgi:hypothetical protein
MSPDEVAQYCKYFNALYTPDNYDTNYVYAAQAAEPLHNLRPHTPVQMQQNIDVLATDYQLVANQTRTPGQVRDELDAAYKPLKDFAGQICS